jgi:hypothetical protein
MSTAVKARAKGGNVLSMLAHVQFINVVGTGRTLARPMHRFVDPDPQPQPYRWRLEHPCGDKSFGGRDGVVESPICPPMGR